MDEQVKQREDSQKSDFRGPIPLADRRRVVDPVEKPAETQFRDWASI